MIDHLIQPASVVTYSSGDKEIFSMHKSGSIVANDLEFASKQLEIRSTIYGVPTSNTFGYRLKVTSKEIGIFRCQHRIMEWFDNNGQRRLICARSGIQPLAESSDFHIEAREFTTKELARNDGELVREALTAWDALYQLGLNFSFEDTGPTDSHQELARSIAVNGTTLMNIDGLHVFDEKIGISEFICSSPVAFDATFDIELVLKSLNEMLTQHFVFSESTALAVELVRSAVKEPSNAASYILTFSALESLTTKSEEKSTEEKKLLDQCITLALASDLPPKTIQSLVSSLNNLKQPRPKTTLHRLFSEYLFLKPMEGTDIHGTVAKIYDLRNKLAHPRKPGEPLKLREVCIYMRAVVISIVWHLNGASLDKVQSIQSGYSHPPTWQLTEVTRDFWYGDLLKAQEVSGVPIHRMRKGATIKEELMVKKNI